MMKWRKWSVFAVALAVFTVQPASAQDRAVEFSVRGGGFNGLTSLNEAETADFKDVGFNIGGGVAYHFNRHVAIRGDFVFAQNDLEIDETPAGSSLDRYFYDAALQLQYPWNGWKPYVFVGAGAVTLDPEGPDNSKTEVAGTTGLGIDFAVTDGLEIGVEAKGWLFDFAELDGLFAGYDKTQFEVTWGLNVSYVVPIG